MILNPHCQQILYFVDFEPRPLGEQIFGSRYSSPTVSRFFIFQGILPDMTIHFLSSYFFWSCHILFPWPPAQSQEVCDNVAWFGYSVTIPF
jgi:hypothetical protein